MFDLGFFLGGSMLFLFIFLCLERPFVCLTKKKKFAIFNLKADGLLSLILAFSSEGCVP